MFSSQVIVARVLFVAITIPLSGFEPFGNEISKATAQGTQLVANDRVFGLDQWVMLRITDVGGLWTELENLDFCKHKGWGEVIDWISHPEWGRLTRNDLVVLQEIRDVIKDGLKPKNLILSVYGTSKVEWQVVFDTELVNAHVSVNTIFARLEQCSFLSKSKLPPDANELQRSMASALGAVPVQSFHGIVFWCALREKVALASSEEALTKLISKLTADQSVDKPLVDSRIYLTVFGAMSPKGSRASDIELFINPSVPISVLSGLSGEEVRVWGLREVLGSGISINIMPSQTRPGAKELLVDVFVQIAVPRKGIFEYIRPLGTPDTMPPIAESVMFFGMLNYDQNFLRNGRERLYDRVNGDGAWRKGRPDVDPVATLIGEDQSRLLAVMGNAFGYYWTKPAIEPEEIVSFFETTNSDRMRQLFMDRESKLKRLSNRMQYQEADINGMPAILMAAGENVDRRFGLLFWKGWVIAASEKTLGTYGQEKVRWLGSCQIDSKVRELRTYFQLKHEPSLVCVMFPEFWKEVRNIWMKNTFRPIIQAELRRRFSEQEDQVMGELLRFIEQPLDFKMPEPASVQDCDRLVAKAIVDIAAETMGGMVVVGTDEETGLRLCAKTFGVEGSRSDDQNK
jgi:hypothetical protein